VLKCFCAHRGASHRDSRRRISPGDVAQPRRAEAGERRVDPFVPGGSRRYVWHTPDVCFMAPSIGIDRPLMVWGFCGRQKARTGSPFGRHGSARLRAVPAGGGAVLLFRVGENMAGSSVDEGERWESRGAELGGARMICPWWTFSRRQDCVRCRRFFQVACRAYFEGNPSLGEQIH